MTRDTRLRLAVGALSAAGIAVAGYLSYSRATDTTLICPTSGCGKVQQSPYSDLLGIPVAYLGIVGYLAILGTTVSARRAASVAGAALAIVGSAFALYLLVAQVAIIDAVCVWCVTSDAILAAILVAAWWRLRPRGRHTPAPRMLAGRRPYL